MQDLIGRTLGHYRIVEKIGEGGMGEVYRAHDERLDRDVAIKVLPSSVAQDRDRIGRFEREARAVAKLSHPNILEIFEFSGDGDVAYAVTELLEGETLREHLKDGPLGWRRAAEIGAAMADGLAAAHVAGIVHRDVKPSNVFLTSDGRLKVLDFGLARTLESGETDASQSPTVSRYTDPGTILGTVAYMSPEQVRGQEVDHRSDVFALGCVLYEMVSGRGPFRHEEVADCMAAILRDDPPPLTVSETPEALGQIVFRCLEKKPGERFQSAAEVGVALRTLAAATSGPLPAPKQEAASIAVLPFANLSPEPDNAYFADGLTEEITVRLSKIRALRVISKSSVVMLQNAEMDIQSIGRQLQVSHVLEGSVRKSGDSLRITAQLINAGDDSHVWSEQYPGTMENVFQIQEDVAQAIAEELRLTLTAHEQRQLAEKPIDDVRAYDFYLRAQHEIWRFTEESLERAVRLIESGIRLTGENEHLLAAMGFVGWSYINSGFIAPEEYEQYLQMTENYAAKLIAASPGSAQGHFLRGMACNKRARQQEAVRELKHALARDPHHANSLFFLSMFYLFAGKGSAVRPLIETLSLVDPLNPWAVLTPGWTDYMDGDFRAALGPCKKAYEMAPEGPLPWLYAILLAGNQRLDDSFRIIDRMQEDSPESNHTRQALFLKYALQGRKEEAIQTVTPELIAWARWDELWPWAMAAGYALIEEKDQAIDWLEHAASRGFIHYPFLSEHDPFLENIRGEERFKKLMIKVKHDWEHFEV